MPAHDHRRRDAGARARRASSSRAARRRCTSTARRRIDPAVYDARRARSSASATAPSSSPSSSAARWPRTGRGEYGRTDAATSPARRPAVRPALPDRAAGVDEPLRRDHRGARRASRSPPPPPGAPVAALEDADRRHLRRAVPPRGRAHRRTARRCSSTSSTTLCGCRPDVDDDVDHRDAGRGRSARQVGDGRVICGLSGGVDSAVAAALVHKAIGAQLTCVFVDTGLHAPGRGRAGGRDVPPPPGHRAHPRAGRRPLPRARSPASPTPRRSARSSASCSSASSRRPPAASSDAALPRAGHAVPRRHRVGHRATPPRSRPTTTSAACPTTWTFELVEPLRNLFKDEVRARRRGARACPRRSCGASRSPARASAVRIIGEVTPEQGRHPAARRRHRPRGDPARPASSARSGRLRRAARHPHRSA